MELHGWIHATAKRLKVSGRSMIQQMVGGLPCFHSRAGLRHQGRHGVGAQTKALGRRLQTKTGRSSARIGQEDSPRRVVYHKNIPGQLCAFSLSSKQNDL